MINASKKLVKILTDINQFDTLNHSHVQLLVDWLDATCLELGNEEDANGILDSCQKVTYDLVSNPILNNIGVRLSVFDGIDIKHIKYRCLGLLLIAPSMENKEAYEKGAAKIDAFMDKNGYYPEEVREYSE